MVVYADVLVVLNLMVDYFLLRLSAIFLKTSVRLWRLLLGAFLGAVSSLYIFAPQLNIAFELIFRILLCAIITLTVFGLGGIKKYLRCFFTFTSVTFGYAGAMIGVWYLFKPYGMVINNSVVYFNISPLWLTVFTVTAYFIVFFVRKVAAKETGFCGKCSLSVFAEGVNVSLTALIDTGNSIEDVFLHSEIIVTDESVLYKLFSGYPNDISLRKRYRALPISTVSGTGMLEGYRCDMALVEYGGRKIKLSRPVLAVSKAELKDGYDAIINPQILE